MAIFDIYSKRRKRLKGEMPDVYQYNELPQSFRVQIVQILREVFGQTRNLPTPILGLTTLPDEWFKQIHKILAKEYGLFRLHEKGNNTQEIVEYFILTAGIDQVLDVIEASFYVADTSDYPRNRVAVLDIVLTPDQAVAELNTRFREHGIGYRFESGHVVRVDSEFLHQEVVKPSLHLLQASHFAGAEKEFHTAHEHYRHQRFQESINESLKALESTLKVICKRKGWSFSERDVASKLIQIVFDRGLIPNYLKSQFNGLRTILEGGVPTIRNRDGGHGTGATPRQVPAHLAAYALHATASAIIFLAEAAGD